MNRRSSIKLFVLASCPGAGKSTVARYISEQVQGSHSRLQTVHPSDYEILHQMFEKDKQHHFFRPGVGDDFIVTDYLVCDIALKRLEKQVNVLILQGNKLVIVEFSRRNYEEAFQLFDPSFLHDSYFLFLDAPVDKGVGRIQQRVISPQTNDDFFVSEEVLERYRGNKNKDYLHSSHFREWYEIEKERVAIIENEGSKQVCFEQVDAFVTPLLEKEFALEPARR